MKIKKTHIVALILSIALFLPALMTMSSCGKKDSISKIVGTYINLNGACSIGIVNKKTEGKAEAKKRNYLVTFDEENRIEEVVFFKDKTNDSGEITQESIKGEIDKCYVTREFTFLRFAAGGAEYNAYRDEEYYTWDYRCDDSYQSFVVDNTTGKVYSLESVGSNCTLMQGGILADGVAYTLSIDGEELRVKRIVDNPNIHVYSVCKDIYDNLFVCTDILDEVDGKIYYFKSTWGTSFSLALGSDGRMYAIEDVDYEDYRVRYFDKNMHLKDVEDDVTVTMPKITYFSNLSFVLKNNCLCTIESGSYSYVRAFARNENSIFGYPLFEKDGMGVYAPNEAYIIADTVFGFEEYTGEVCAYDWFESGVTREEILKAKTCCKEENYLVATAESASATKKYKIWMENGVVKTELIKQTVYEEEIFTLQALN